MATTFENQCVILADLWLNYRDHEELEDFVEYNDLGLPLAYLIHTELATVTEEGIPYVEETFNLLCSALDLNVEADYISLNEMLGESEEEEQDCLIPLGPVRPGGAGVNIYKLDISDKTFYI